LAALRLAFIDVGGVERVGRQLNALQLCYDGQVVVVVLLRLEDEIANLALVTLAG